MRPTRHPRRSATIAVLAVLACAVAGPTVGHPATADAANARVIRVSGDGFVTRFGPFRHMTTQRSVWRVFHRPQRRKRIGGSACRAMWTDDGAQFLMTSFVGTRSRRVCRPNHLYVQTASVFGHRWRTDEGLYADDPAARIADLYPGADGLPEAPEEPDPDEYLEDPEGLAEAQGDYATDVASYTEELSTLTHRVTLEEGYFPYGDEGTYPTVTARVHGGHIRSIDFWVGGAGE